MSVLGCLCQARKRLAQTEVQRSVNEQWWELAAMLVIRYNDAHFNFPDHAPTTQAAIGYPAFWLEMIGFNAKSYKPQWFEPAACSVPMLLSPEDRAQAQVTCPGAMPQSQADAALTSLSTTPLFAQSLASLAFVAVFSGASGLGMGYFLWGRPPSVEPSSYSYLQIA